MRDANENLVTQRDEPLTIWYGSLAGLLQAQGRYEQAEPLFRQAMEILQTKLGLDHPNTVTARKNYDSLLELKKQNADNPR